MSSREPHGIRAPLEEPPGRPRQHCCRRTSRRPHRGCSSHPASPRSLSHARSAVQMDEVPVNISSRHVTGVGAGRRRRAARSVPGGVGAMRITYAGRCTCRVMPTRGKFESEDAAPVVDDHSRRCSVDAAHSPPHTENGTLITTLAPAVVWQTGDARRDDSLRALRRYPATSGEEG